MTCRYDRDQQTYLNDGQPCTHDNYGDKTYHCTARRSCANHIGSSERTCALCIHRTKTTVKQIADLAALMPTAAIAAGIDSDAANLAGPSANPEAWDHVQASIEAGRLPATWTEDDNDSANLHPVYLLAKWANAGRTALGLTSPAADDLVIAVGFLLTNLHTLAQREGFEFPKLAREAAKCRTHLESTIRNSHANDRGAPCPECATAGKVVRLNREYGHWCEDPNCEQIHYADDTGDTWRCPANRTEHAWTHQAYESYVKDRQALR